MSIKIVTILRNDAQKYIYYIRVYIYNIQYYILYADISTHNRYIHYIFIYFHTQ